MQRKYYILQIFGWIFLSAATLGFSQTAPAARSSNLPLSVGMGYSDFNADWANSRVYGGTVWINYYPGILSRHLTGLGLDIEARDLSYNKPLVLHGFKQDTAGGGAIYSWHHFRNVRPYAKGLIEYGSFDFNVGSPTYHHDTRTVYAIGAGLDYHIFGHIWARGDYEYQTWQNLPALGTGDPTPNGFTFGAVYDFRATHSER